MKIIGIIAEYNPFHNGHAYQITKIKEMTGADFVVIALSGDFVQRGTPAVIDKYARTKMALSCGADLVIELPALWATASAESFAMAGVTLFDKMGCVDGLCFGAETSDFEMLSAVAAVLAKEPAEYSGLLSQYLKKGLSFPAARAKTLLKYLSGTVTSDMCPDSTCIGFCSDSEKHSSALSNPTALETIVSTPNNILAIEYLKALKKRNSNIKPLLLRREGAGYHDTLISPSADIPNASATAIRKALSEHSSVSDELLKTMPAAAYTILQEYAKEYPFLWEDDFSSILNYLLLFYSNSDSVSGNQMILSDFGDSNTDIANRLVKNLCHFQSFSQFCERNKSRDITYTRMSRILLHILLHITNEDYQKGKSLDYIPYFRLLGFKKDSAGLLTQIKQTSQIPMISKLADTKNLLGQDALWLLEKDIFAADLYEQVLCNGQKPVLDRHSASIKKKKTIPRSEYSREIVLL